MREAPLEFRAGAFCGGCLTRQQARDRCLQATRREVHKLTMSREFAEWYTNKQTSAIVTWWCAFALGLLVIAASTAAAGVLYLWVRDTQKVLADTQGKALLVPAPETAPLPDTEMATDANAKLGETATGDERKGPSCDWDPYDVGEMYESARPEDNLLSNEGCGYASVDQRQHANDLRMEEPIWEDCARSLKQQLINEEKLGTACIRLLQSRRGTAAWLLCVATVMVAFALGKFWDLQRQLAGLKEALRLEKLKAENFAASHEGVPSINGEQERQDEHADSSDNESEQQDEVKAALHSLDRIAAELPKEEERVETLREKVARLETLNEERMVLEPKVNTLRKAEEEMADCEKHIEAMEERLKKLPELRLKERGLLEKSTETEDLIAKVESMMGKAAIIDVVTDVHNRMKEDADAADRMLMDMKGTEGQLERARAEYVDKETRIKDEIEKLQMNLNQRLPMLEKERDELQAKARDLASTPGLESATAVPPGSVVATSAVELDTRKNDRSMRKMKQSQLDAKMEDMLAKLEGEKKRLEEALAAEREQSASWTRKAQQAQQTLSNLKRRMQESSRTGHLQLSYRSLYQTETPMVSLGVLKKPQETCNENAYAVLVMRGDKYALGAAVVAYQLKQLNARADVVCLVTREVSPEARQALSTVFDAIYECPLVQFDCIEMTTQKQRDFYGEWISESFTKWNVLLLTMYKKVLLVDADLLPLTNIDNLFTLNAPAATFSSPWSSEYKGGGGYDDPYKGLVHGRSVDQQMIFSAIDASLRYDKGGKGSYVGLGSLVLVEPSADQFQSLLAFVSARQPFGVPGCHSGFDEQSIVFYFNAHHPNRGWTHISQEYNCLAWHRKWIRGAQPKCYHYFNEKPWTQHPQSYEDVPVWYDAAAGLRKSHPETEVLFEKCLKDMNFIESHIVGPSSKGRNS